MKIQLNMISGRVAPFRVKSLRRILSTTLLLAFFLSIMAMGYIYIDNYYEIKDYQNQLALISKRHTTLNKQVFRIMEYKREWDSLRHKISLISELKGKQIWWTPKLQALAELMPENIWINKLSVQKSVQASRKASSSGAKASRAAPSSMTLILEGFALPGDNQGFRSIENFAHQLKENPAFSTVIEEINLATATRTEKEKLSALSFRLSCKLTAEKSL
ncbi:PilN domain-containing protein [Candidatus Aerophobetes bacterium]|nr:PilN domain-containing protein [Candidatus Aerophobetes bacterium]